MSESLGHLVRIQFRLAANEATVAPVVSRPERGRQRTAQIADHPLVKRASELFDARVVWMEEPQG